MTERRPHPSDLSDARWALIAPRLTAWRQARTDAGVGGRAPTHDLREIFNAILYVNRTGIAWRYLPHDFPPHATVYGYFATWSKEGIFTDLNYQLTGLVRDHHGRAIEPTASIMDSQSVKTSTSVPLATQGTDAGKKIVGRERGIITDTLGLLLAVIVTAASASDNAVGGSVRDCVERAPRDAEQGHVVQGGEFADGPAGEGLTELDLAFGNRVTDEVTVAAVIAGVGDEPVVGVHASLLGDLAQRPVLAWAGYESKMPL